MSKIQNALKRAAEERDLKHGSRSADALPGTQEIWQEVHRLESSLVSWSAARQASQTAPASSPANAGQPAVSSSALPGQTWKEALTQCERRLSACDDQIVRHLEQQATLEAQVETQERMVTQATAALAAQRRRLEETQHAAKSVEAEKAAVQQQVDALRECQKLSDASDAAAQELRAATEVITHTLDQQQRLAEKLAQYQQHRQTVQRTAEGLQRQLQQALARVEDHRQTRGDRA